VFFQSRGLKREKEKKNGVPPPLNSHKDKRGKFSFSFRPRGEKEGDALKGVPSTRGEKRGYTFLEGQIRERASGGIYPSPRLKEGGKYLFSR